MSEHSPTYAASLAGTPEQTGTTCDRCGEPEWKHTSIEKFCPFISTFRAAATPASSDVLTDETAYHRLRALTLGAKGGRADYGQFMSGADAAELLAEIDRARAARRHITHNHGTEEGPGLACREIRLSDGRMLGACLLPPTFAKPIRLDDVRATLREHWLTSVRCHHDEKADTSHCYCTVWASAKMPSVGRAVDAWIEHVVESLASRSGTAAPVPPSASIAVPTIAQDDATLALLEAYANEEARWAKNDRRAASVHHKDRTGFMEQAAMHDANAARVRALVEALRSGDGLALRLATAEAERLALQSFVAEHGTDAMRELVRQMTRERDLLAETLQHLCANRTSSTRDAETLAEATAHAAEELAGNREPAPDTERLNWWIDHASRRRYAVFAGQKGYVIKDLDGNTVGEGCTPRDAIDNARERDTLRPARAPESSPALPLCSNGGKHDARFACTDILGSPAVDAGTTDDEEIREWHPSWTKEVAHARAAFDAAGDLRLDQPATRLYSALGILLGIVADRMPRREFEKLGEHAARSPAVDDETVKLLEEAAADWDEREAILSRCRPEMCRDTPEDAHRYAEKLRALAAALRRSPEATSRDARQTSIATWVAATFGESAMSPTERARRFFEEAAELAQSVGLSGTEAARIVSAMYARDPGEPAKEIGQVGLTLVALAEAVQCSAEALESAEWARVQSKSTEEWRARRDKKVAMGIAATPPASDTRAEDRRDA